MTATIDILLAAGPAVLAPGVVEVDVTRDWVELLLVGVLPGLGALAAALVALDSSVWRPRRRRPRLSISGFADDAEILDFGTGEGVPVKVLALTVMNAQDKETAHDVELVLTATCLHPAGPVAHVNVDGASVVWRHPALGELARSDWKRDIPAGAKRDVMLGLLGKPRDVASLFPDVPQWKVDSAWEAVGAWTLWPVDESSFVPVMPNVPYRIEVTLVGSNFNAQSHVRYFAAGEFSEIRPGGYFAQRVKWSSSHFDSDEIPRPSS